MGQDILSQWKNEHIVIKQEKYFHHYVLTRKQNEKITQAKTKRRSQANANDIKAHIWESILKYTKIQIYKMGHWKLSIWK